MELELGLGISISSKVPILKELDLISYVNYHGDDDNDNSSALSSQSSVINYEDEGENDGFSYNYMNEKKKNKKKRNFEEAFEVESNSSVSSLPTKTLPLLLWDKDPNEQDKLPKRLCKSNSFSFNKNEEDGIVGWPPVKSFRKKLCQQTDAQPNHHHNRQPAVENGGGLRSMYVKVQMEGCLITRKIDLKLYECYESLTYSLLTMFSKGECSVDGYMLTYQDREGDWLLAGDVPWRTFIESVQRLKLLKREA